ncbi:hypothetical protein BC828DRAFT_302984 [Blastocladiella britannica]|nr:hypothetical protein BC828DRAFT_304746 [Blastocladiella britannica]KAI9216493.1 hypothetical protein BC828DRAFT_302984 [Blastocladiella britannica]
MVPELDTLAGLVFPGSGKAPIGRISDPFCAQFCGALGHTTRACPVLARLCGPKAAKPAPVAARVLAKPATVPDRVGSPSWSEVVEEDAGSSVLPAVGAACTGVADTVPEAVAGGPVLPAATVVHAEAIGTLPDVVAVPPHEEALVAQIRVLEVQVASLTAIVAPLRALLENVAAALKQQPAELSPLVAALVEARPLGQRLPSPPATPSIVFGASGPPTPAKSPDQDCAALLRAAQMRAVVFPPCLVESGANGPLPHPCACQPLLLHS